MLEQILVSKGLVLVKPGEAGWTSLFCKTACTSPDKMKGMSGYDWATFKNETSSVNADFFRNLLVDAPLTLATAGAGSRWSRSCR